MLRGDPAEGTRSFLSSRWGTCSAAVDNLAGIGLRAVAGAWPALGTGRDAVADHAMFHGRCRLDLAIVFESAERLIGCTGRDGDDRVDVAAGW